MQLIVTFLGLQWSPVCCRHPSKESMEGSRLEPLYANWRIQLGFNTLQPIQNGRHFAGTFKRIFVNENVRILIEISLKFVPKGPIDNIPALVQIMAWRRQGDKPLSEPMMICLPTHTCVTRPQWVNQPMQATVYRSSSCAMDIICHFVDYQCAI